MTRFLVAKQRGKTSETGEATIDIKQAMTVLVESLFAELETKTRKIEELKAEVTRWRTDPWASRVTYENVVDLIASNEDAAVRDQTRKVFEPLLKKETVRQLQRDVKRKVKEMETADGVAPIVVNNHFENGSTAQVFNGPTTGVFKE